MIMKKDLTDTGDKDYDSRKDEFILCPRCGAEISGNRGDYWSLPDEYVFKCECGCADLALVKRKIEIQVIKQ